MKFEILLKSQNKLIVFAIFILAATAAHAGSDEGIRLDAGMGILSSSENKSFPSQDGSSFSSNLSSQMILLGGAYVLDSGMSLGLRYYVIGSTESDQISSKQGKAVRTRSVQEAGPALTVGYWTQGINLDLALGIVAASIASSEIDASIAGNSDSGIIASLSASYGFQIMGSLRFGPLFAYSYRTYKFAYTAATGEDSSFTYARQSINVGLTSSLAF